MAKGKGEVQGWITRNGVHVPIYDNYTVRGGAEPKAKGSKFKGLNKKKPDRNVTLRGTSDTLRMMDKHGIEADYDEKTNTYNISEEDYQKMEDASKNKDYIKRLRKDSGEREIQTHGYIDKSEKSSGKDDHYDTKLNSIRDRMRSGEITKEQAQDEAFEYEKSQRGNKRWTDQDRNNMESKVRDIFSEANSSKQAQNGAPRVTDEEAKKASDNGSSDADNKVRGNKGNAVDSIKGKTYKFDGNAIKGKKSAEEMTGQKLMLKELSNSATDTTYAFVDSSGNEVGRFFESHTSKTGNKMELYNKKSSNASAGTDKSPYKDTGNKAGTQNLGGMTVSGLKSAYAEASGSERSKIAAALRAKGYRFTGGKWVKG
jgi:hypothetical protein